MKMKQDTGVRVRLLNRGNDACFFNVNRDKKINSSDMLTIGYLTNGNGRIKWHESITKALSFVIGIMIMEREITGARRLI